MVRCGATVTLSICALVAASACDFERGMLSPGRPDTLTDSPPIDVVSPPTLPASCKEVLADDPASESGPYMIDPDGSGPEAPVSVACDMHIAGGGWTRVFTASNANYVVPPSYDIPSPALLAGAQSALIVYRTAAGDVIGSFATFDLPSAWRTDSPFVAPATDLDVPVSVDGAAPATRTLRFGKANFVQNCPEAWIGGSVTYGRICIVGTTAPFYNGFATTADDRCTNSQAAWYRDVCSSDSQFSISIR